MNCIRCRLVQSLESSTVCPKLLIRHTRHHWQIQRPISKYRIPQSKNFSTTTRRPQQKTGNVADDDASWISVVDRDPVIVKVREGHGPGIILLALIPITAFALGTWQVKRLQWKTDLIARYEDQLIRDPLPLPPHVNPASIPEFDFRRVVAYGTYRHDQEMLIGPRMRDGEEGYLVVTPLQRTDAQNPNGGSKILVCRGWISKAMREQRARGDGHGEAMPLGEVTVEGLLREPPKKNFVTPENQPEKGEFYFPDVVQMAKLVGAEPIWIEETMQLELFETMRRTAKGIPIGREPAVTLSNNHAQYIFTWYALSIATSVMFWMVFKKKPKGARDRVTRSTEW